MKILLISNKAPYPPKDGQAIAVFNMANGLLDNGAEVHVLVINTKKQFRPDENIPVDFRVAANYQSVFRNTDVTALGAFANMFSRDSYFVSRFFFEDYAEALKRKLNEVKFDIVQIEGVFMAVYLPIIREYSKAKVVLRSHNIEYVIWERYIQSSSNKLKNLYINIQKNRLKKFEIDVFNNVDAIVPITSVDGDALQQIVPNKPIHSSITGIDLRKYPAIAAAKVPSSIFYFGSMDWLPNLEAVEWFKSNCWEQVKRNTSADLKWIIAGLNMPAHILAYADNDDRIETIANVPDAFEFYQTYNIQLAPILSGSGLRIKLVEGISYGKPIITTAIGMEGLGCTNDKELRIADTAASFASNVIELANDVQLQQRLSSAARAYAVQHFDNKTLTSRLLSFYEGLPS
jgi:glycosyltransferase involved in cell wall biosynthesis